MSPLTTASGDPFVGTDRFQIVRKIGAGGMGVVYEALDRESGQQVALKTLKELDPTAVFRFKQEFRSLTELSHPNLVPLYELISDGEQWFFVMELIADAVDFSEYLKEAPPPPIPSVADRSPTLADSATITGDGAAAEAPIDETSAWQVLLPVDDHQPQPAADTDALAQTVSEGDDAAAETQPLVNAPVSSPPDPATPGVVAGPADPDELGQTVIPGAGELANPAPQGTTVWEDVDVDAASAATERHLAGADAAIEQTIVKGFETPEIAPSVRLAVNPTAVRPPVQITDFARLRSVFRQLCAGVRALHVKGKLHCDLKPGNALVSRKTGAVVLLDFGLVSELAHHQRASVDRTAARAGIGSGDHSSGTYSSTASSTFDRQIAGTVGFMSPEQAAGHDLTEASDWYAVGVMLFQALTGRLPITGHAFQVLQRKQLYDAPAPADLVSGVPEEWNTLCVKLLRRDPARRPQGPDIAAVFAAEDAPNSPANEDDFTPGSMPFVGRERHIAALNQAFEQTLAGKTVVCKVHGKSGAGKSALIQHFLDDLTHRQHAVVLAGRCYEQESVPYKGIDSLIDALTHFLRNPAVDAAELIPQNAAALARIFPVLKRVTLIEKLCDQQAVAGDLRELRRDAFQALGSLLSRIGERHRLVVYLDDLQWGDNDSAALLADLLSSAAALRVLLILAYRSEYLGASECLQMLAAAEASQAPWTELTVAALTSAETRTLARRLLRGDLPNVDANADRIVEQSGGSAYFVYELARHLNAGLDLSAIGGTSLDAVLWSRVGRLSDEAQRLLHMVAVAGHPTRLRNVLEAANLLQVSPRLMTVLRIEHLIRSNGPGMSAEVEAFHDRIRESVVNHLAPGVKKRHHAELAASLEGTADAQPESIALHLEASDQLVKAGRCYLLAGELAVQVLAFDRAEEFYNNAVRLAQTDVDRAEALEKLIHFLTDIARFAEAYAVGRESVLRFGLKLPKSFVPPLFLIDFLKAKLRIGRRPAVQLLSLPTMTDLRLSTALRLASACAKAAYQVRPELCVAVSTKIVNECLKHGNTPDCAIGWMVFGAIFQGGVLGNHPAGHEFGRLALSLVDKYQNEQQRAEVSFVVGYFGTSWMQPATAAEALWKTAYESGRATGDLFHTGCACAATAQSLLMRGVTFDEIWKRSSEQLDWLRPLGLREPIGAIESVRQTIRNLRGETRAQPSFSDETFHEETYVAKLSEFGSRHFAHMYFINKMLTQYLWRRFDEAWATSQISARHLKESPGMLHAAEHWFLTGLIAAALADRGTGGNRRRMIGTLRTAHRSFAKWASRCPHNFLHKERVLAGELARTSGAREAALSAFEQAAAAATEFGYLQIAALAHELTARVHESTGLPRDALKPRESAHDLFRRWGATAIANRL